MLKGDYGKKSFINPITKLVLLVTLPAFLMGGLGGTDAEIFTLIFPLVSLFLLFISKNLKAGTVGLLMYIAVIIAWSVLPSGSYGIFHIILFIVVGIVTGLLPCALMSVYVISSTTASEFITGMKKLFIPDVITIPMSVIFRFFPTVKEEIQAINKAMTMRGIRFGGRNAAGILEYRLIPILMCSLKIGDELSAAALTRGLDSPRKRTNICDTRFRFQDFFLLALCFCAYLVCVLSLFGIHFGEVVKL